MDLIGVTQISEMLVMTRAGAHKLIEREADFPVPVSTLANGTRVWERQAVENWARLPGHRRAVRFFDALGTEHQYRIHITTEQCVAVPLKSILHEPLLEWAREAQHLKTEEDRINESMVFVPLRDWDSRVDMTGRIK